MCIEELTDIVCCIVEGLQPYRKVSGVEPLRYKFGIAACDSSASSVTRLERGSESEGTITYHMADSHLSH